MTNEELWQGALGEIELSISKANFITWFKNTTIISQKDGQVIISVPNGFAKEWLENKYNIHILRALRNINPSIKTVSCVIAPLSEPENPRELSVDAIIAPKNPVYTTQKAYPHHQKSNLNPKYTFDNFIVGGNNELAHAACYAVAQNLGKIYNPLFIYGGVGLGKTHLIQSIGNELHKSHPELNVFYITSEDFTNNFINAVQDGQMNEFKRIYQNIDLLIIDDIQFISGKEKTQDQFFHIFNSLYQANKQIVLSSDRPPKAISILEERLKSRFEGGMIADVIKPDLETRMAILQRRVEREKIPIEQDALEFIAQNVKNNVRELEGALNRVSVSAQLTKQIITVDYATKILSELISSGKKGNITYKHILKTISSFYDISLDDLLAKNRKREVVKPRQIAMFLMRSELRYSYPGIGEKLGGRDHTTAIHAYEKIQEALKNDEKLLEEISLIKEQLYTIS